MPSDGASIAADGSVRIAADEKLDLDLVAGNISGGGTAAVGAAAAVPVITKTTTAYIGDYAQRHGQGRRRRRRRQDRALDLTQIDTRFDRATAVVAATRSTSATTTASTPASRSSTTTAAARRSAGLTDNGVDIDGAADGLQSAVYYVLVVDAPAASS